MLFPTLSFGLFFLVVYALAWAVSASNEWRKICLLLASWFFYGAWDGRFVALLIVSATANWFLAARIAATHHKGVKRGLVVLGVAFNLAILGWFKYFSFFIGQLAAALHYLGCCWVLTCWHHLEQPFQAPPFDPLSCSLSAQESASPCCVDKAATVGTATLFTKRLIVVPGW